MKRFFLPLALFAATLLQAQEGSRVVSYTDPSLSNLRFTDERGNEVNTDRLMIGTPVRLQFTVRNNDIMKPVPAGTSKLMITLGSRFRSMNDILPAVQDLPMNNYFRWTLEEATRQNQFIIYGELIRDLPARYEGTVSFPLMPFRGGSSTATCQWMVTNDGRTDALLSDMNPGNNIVYRSYTSLKPLGIRFTALRAQPHGCVLEVNWSVYDEDKAASKYIIEVSEDGSNYRAVKTVMSTGMPTYNVLLEGLSSTQVNVRVRVEAANANDYLYSDKVTATNLCDKKFEIALYPNPVPSDASEITLSAKAGIFNGKYQIRLSDASGREVKRSDVTYSNQLQVKFPLGVLSGGSYFVTVVGEDGQAQALPFVRQ